uniref:Uncharacterized protein n=1 Tax=Graphocephala atropunctata TaxID=36148 RepID=A0A1B6MBS3_9HEMI
MFFTKFFGILFVAGLYFASSAQGFCCKKQVIVIPEVACKTPIPCAPAPVPYYGHHGYSSCYSPSYHHAHHTSCYDDTHSCGYGLSEKLALLKNKGCGYDCC